MIQIHWGWLPVVFLAGTLFGGIVVIAVWGLCSVAGMADDKAERTLAAIQKQKA